MIRTQEIFESFFEAWFAFFVKKEQVANSYTNFEEG